MKIRLFKSVSRGGKTYWSVTGRNYKNNDDKVTYFFSFTQNTVEPTAKLGGEGAKTYEYADIDIQDAKFGCYNNSPSITIFKYQQLEDIQGRTESRLQDINLDDLPF